jgi:dihydroorotase
MSAVAARTGIGGVLGSLRLDAAWLIDPLSGRQGEGSIVIEDGAITELRWAEGSDEPSGAGRPDVVVAPGFIDLAAHLREPGGEDAETFATGLAAAGHGGFVAVCAVADTRPPVDRTEVVQRVVAAAASTGVPVAMRPFGAVTVGREGKTLAPLVSLASAGVVGFGDAPAPSTDPALLRAALTEAGSLGLPVVVHADEPSLTSGSEANDGLPATILGLHGAPAAAEVSAVSRAIAVLRQVAAEVPPDSRPHLHLAQLSSAGSLEPLRAARAEGLRVTADVAPHHLALHDGWLGGDRRWSWDAAPAPWAGEPAEEAPYTSSVRVEPPLRGPEDAIALLAALEEGVVDAVASHHAPARAVDKEVPFGDAAPGISGLETTLGLLLEAVAAGRLGLVRAIRALTIGPWRVIDGARHGIAEPALRPGAEASVVVFDRASRWDVSPETMRTRGLTTPLVGRSLPGRVAWTIARGRVAWSDEGVVAPGTGDPT